MSVQADVAPLPAPRRGFMFGELLMAVVLLAVAISSVTALMYSVGRHPRQREAVDCTAKASATLPECAKSAKAKSSATNPRSAAKLLVSGCATRTTREVKDCNDSVASARAAEGTTLRSRTDSASLQLLPKRPKRATRPDLGFVR